MWKLLTKNSSKFSSEIDVSSKMNDIQYRILLANEIDEWGADSKNLVASR